MAVTIQSSPGTAVRASHQHLIFTLDEATTPERFIVQVFENDNYTSTPNTAGTEIAKLYLTPNAEGRAHFDLSDIVGDRVESCVQVGSMGGNIFVHTATTIPSTSVQKVVRQYIIRAGQYNDGVEDLGEAFANVHLFNGVAQISQGKNPSYSFLYPTGSTQQVWFTDRNLVGSDRYFKMHMADEDEGTLQFAKTGFILGGPSETANRVDIKQFRGTSTLVAQLNYTISISLALSGNVYQIPCGPAQLDTKFAGGLHPDWTYLTFQVTQTGLAKSRIFRVVRDCRPIKHDPVQLCWVNTLGAWDFLRFDGRNLKSISTESKTYRKSVGSYGGNSFTFNPYDAQVDTYHKTGKERYNLQNLHFRPEELELLQYAFRSKQVFFRVASGDWLPCQIQTDTYTVRPAASQLFEVSLDIELAQDIRC